VIFAKTCVAALSRTNVYAENTKTKPT